MREYTKRLCYCLMLRAPKQCCYLSPIQAAPRLQAEPSGLCPLWASQGKLTLPQPNPGQSAIFFETFANGAGLSGLQAWCLLLSWGDRALHGRWCSQCYIIWAFKKPLASCSLMSKIQFLVSVCSYLFHNQYLSSVSPCRVTDTWPRCLGSFVIRWKDNWFWLKHCLSGMQISFVQANSE